MQKFITWLLALGFIITPGLASAENGTDGNASTPVSAQEIQEMKALLKAQSEALQQQRAALEQAEQRMKELQQRLGLAEASPTIKPAVAASVAAAMVEPKAAEKKEEPAPLYFRIGGAKFTPGGFLDFVTFFRSTNVGSGVATTFNSIPYSNTAAGQMSELRMGAQSSRIALKVDSTVGQNKVLGYVETDFVGNSAPSMYVTSNSMTLRMRMFLADVQRGKLEFTGGQAWTLMTPSRRSLGVLPSDLLIPYVGDANYQVGFSWARQAQFRVTYHPSDNWTLAASIENPQQYVAAGAVTCPSVYSAALASQLDAASNSAAPNLHPDFVVKFAHDQKVGARNWHVEGGGIVRSFKVAIKQGSVYNANTATGGALTAGTTFELFKNFNLVGNVVWGNGAGRYLAGLAPDLIVKSDGAPSLVHSGSVLTGFEWIASKNTTIAAYYGGIYAGRNAFVDVTSATYNSANPATWTYGGFGGYASPNSANRSIQEGTLVLTQTFWKNPNYGALQFISQGSYLTRSPWYVAPSAPKNAHLFLSTAGIRYVLP